MATVYSPPKGFEAPAITMEDYRDQRWEAIEAEYIERLAACARDVQCSEPDPIIGKVVRFPYADGYAQYLVWSVRPLQLVHLDLGDGWAIPDAHARGLRLTDIRA